MVTFSGGPPMPPGRTLQQALQGLMQGMQGLGLQPGNQFGQAGQSMGQAQGNLGRGQPGPAITNQSDALEALRQAARRSSGGGVVREVECRVRAGLNSG